MKSNGWIPLAVSFLVLTIVLSLELSLSKREKFECFLIQEQLKIPQLSNKDLDGSPRPTRPDLAAIQDYFMTLDPNLGRVPTERLKNAYLKTKSISRQKSAGSFGTNIVWNSVPSNMAGRTRSFMIDPNDPSGKKAWVGSVTGGLWFNNDFLDDNSPWLPLDDFWSNLVVSSIIHDPNDTDVFYVGTGEAQTAFTIYRESSGVGVGIWKTTDGGQSWSLIPSTENFKYITDIAIRDEEGTSVIYACVTSGVYKGEDHESLPSNGLYRSTDNGNSWAQVLPNIVNTNTPYAPADIEITTSGKIFIGSMRNLDDQGGGTILYSDEGTLNSWSIYDDYVSIIENSPTYNIPGRVILAGSPSNPNVIYALLDVARVNPTNGFKDSKGQYILKSTNEHVSWLPTSIPNDYWATIGWHALAATVDPNDENTLFIGGLDTYKTTDGGSSWKKISDWTGLYHNQEYKYVHADIHKILFLNNNSDEMIITTDGGVFYTPNATQVQPTFSGKNRSYNSLQFYSCAIDPREGTGIYMGGLQDNGTVLYTGTPLSNTISGGDGAYCFIDKNEPNIMISSTYYNQYYLYRDGVIVTIAGNNYGSGTFINPADYDNKLNTLYANATTFLRANKNSLLRISGIPDNPIETIFTITTDVNVPFSHIAISPYSPANSTTLFAGTESGRLFKVFNAQNNPYSTEIGSNNFPTGNISCIAIGESEDHLLVTFSNYGVSSIWQTDNGGDSWSEKESNLPDMPIRWAIYHPQDDKQALIATEAGVWGTDELDQENPTWLPVNNGLANVRVDMLKVRKSDNAVLAATHGRGLTSTVFTPLGIDDDKNIANHLKVYPNPTNGKIKLSLTIDQSADIQIQLIDPSGRLLHSERKGNMSGELIKSFDLTPYPKGIYVINILIDGDNISRKVIYQ
ncbi:MAG: T9SS type A sorting domain-containing protein [Bacteroidetes bacterium]|nr:T9SS type A sorting domain-containing protein [Bacteroidota bacterium]